MSKSYSLFFFLVSHLHYSHSLASPVKLAFSFPGRCVALGRLSGHHPTSAAAPTPFWISPFWFWGFPVERTGRMNAQWNWTGALCCTSVPPGVSLNAKRLALRYLFLVQHHRQSSVERRGERERERDRRGERQVKSYFLSCLNVIRIHNFVRFVSCQDAGRIITANIREVKHMIHWSTGTQFCHLNPLTSERSS